MPKGKQKPKVNAPGSPINGAPLLYKVPPIPKAREKQQRWTPETGVVDKIKKDKRGDLVKPANPSARSVPLRDLSIIETDGDKYLNKIPLPDGSVYIPPKKQRTY